MYNGYCYPLEPLSFILACRSYFFLCMVLLRSNCKRGTKPYIWWHSAPNNSRCLLSLCVERTHTDAVFVLFILLCLYFSSFHLILTSTPDFFCVVLGLLLWYICHWLSFQPPFTDVSLGREWKWWWSSQLTQEHPKSAVIFGITSTRVGWPHVCGLGF